MKKTLTSWSRKTISILLATIMILTTLFVGSIITAKAYNFKSGRVYFDDTNTGWGSAYLVVNYDSNSGYYAWKQMTAITGTKLFYYNISANDSNVHRYYFTKSSQTDGNNKTINSNYAGSFGWDFNGGNAYFTPSGNNGSVSGSYNDNAINNIGDYKVNLTAKVAISDDYGSTYTEQTSGTKGGKVTVKACYWSSATATSGTIGNSNTSYTSITYENAVKTGTATWEYSDVGSDYEFVKWSTTVGGSEVTSTSAWRVTGTRTLYAHFRKKPYTINVSAKTGGTVSTTGGTVSPSSFSDQTPSSAANTITATPNTANNYVFGGWTSANGNITFANASNATTTFTSSGPDTIYGNFTLETLYPVTVYLDGSTSTSVNAGNTVNPEITAADRSSEDYEFTNWTLTGNVQLASGYTADNQTIKIKATGSGGTVTANYTHVDYLYFYGALQSNWNSNPVVTVDGNIVSPYAYLADKENSDSPITLYSSSNTNNPIGANNCNTYYIGIYRVPVAKIGKNISVFNSQQTGTNASNGYQGTVQSGNGHCYITYSSGQNDNHVQHLNPQKVTEVTTNKSQYDGDVSVIVSKTETVYGGTKTAGQDTFKWKYTIKNTSTDAETTLSDWSTSTSTVDFTPDSKGLAAGTYKVIIYTKDDTTGKMLNFCESSNFTIDTTPTQSTINFNITNGTATAKYTYKGGSETSFSSGASLRAGSQVTITVTCNIGYQIGTTSNTASGLTAPTITTTQTQTATTTRKSKGTITFTVPTASNTSGSSLTISHTASEIKKTIKVQKQYINSSGNTVTDTVSNTKKAGVVTAVALDAPPSVTDNAFSSWSVPSNLTVTDGSTTTNASISVKLNNSALANITDTTVTIIYIEALHIITVQTDGNGNVKRGSDTVSGTTTQIGNITAVTLSANNNLGYEFKQWEITPASSGGATSCTVNGTQRTLSGSKITIAAASAPASTTFKFNGKATLKAVFQAVAISISAHFPSNHGYTTSSTTGNDVYPSITSGIIDNTYDIIVLLAPGYEVASIQGTGISSTMPTPTTDTNGKLHYTYTLGAVNVDATVTLKAKKPTLSNVHIKDTSLEYVQYGTTGTINVPMYYGQPAMAYATTDSFSKLEYRTYKANGTTTHASATNKNSGVEVSVASDPTIIPTTEIGTVTYTFRITASNKPAGITTAATTYKNYTVNVSFNDTQKVCFRLKKLTANRIMNEDTDNNPYYKNGSEQQLLAYNTAASAVTTFINNSNNSTYNGYPLYNADANGELSAAQAIENAYSTAYDNLMLRANTTTVYVLTKYANSSSNPINFKTWINDSYSGFTSGDKGDFAHFKMMDYDSMISGTEGNYPHFHMKYEGKFTKNGDRYLYSFTYTGHIGFLVYRGDTATDVTVDDDSKKIVSDVQKLSDNNFGNYYYNAYNTEKGSPVSATPTGNWVEWGHQQNVSGKVLLDKNVSRTAAQLRTALGISEKGSLVSAPGIQVTNTVFTITGPDSTSYNMLTGNFPATKQGKYTVTYTSRYGYGPNGTTPITVTDTYNFWVSCDEIDIYVDMNDNVGNPILNFKYFVNASGDPVASGTEAYLPYEMELVTGSESIYKYTVKIPTLRDRYLINTATNIKIEYITVENQKIGLGSGFTLSSDEAKITGEAWLKADSTKLTTFNLISYGSGTRGFMAVDANGNFLSGAIKSVKGTGVITDDEVEDEDHNSGELYKTKYAAKYTIDGQNAPIKSFGSTLNVKLNEEITSETNTYYFDKWVKINKGADDLMTNFSMDGNSDYSDKADLNYSVAPTYGSGESDATYIAVYKQATSSDSTVRVVVTYNFKDYNTSDGNYVFDANKKRLDASYTKTIKVKVGSGQTYADFAAVESAVNAIASANMPIIKSNYFDYSYGGIVEDEQHNQMITSTSSKSKIEAEVYLTEQAHPYRIVVKDGNNIVSNTTGYYQQTVELTSNKSTPAWKDKNGKLLAVGASYTARYVSSGFDSDTNNSISDCQIIQVDNTGGSVSNKSVISNSYTEQYFDGTSKRLRHNFYIVDYCEENKLIGGGVLYATLEEVNGTWTYRQTNAATQLASAASRKTFVEGILDGDYDTEYKAQTINNVGFRYKPYNSKEDIYRYSDIMSAYQYTYSTTNANIVDYDGQKLRVFSFMVYDNNGTPEVVVSDGYGEVSRYIA